MLPIRLITATRADRAAFEQKSLLGRSLARLAYNPQITAVVHCNNQSGLPLLYNAEISPGTSGSILLFVHDDIWIDDFFLQERLNEALDRFDVVGLAGTRVLHPEHHGWAFPNDSPNWDRPENLSGAVGHVREGGVSRVTYFAPSGASVVLLDGLFLAAKSDTLREAGVMFDPRFRFHFYDLDFCRTATVAGLRLGTWPIAVTHASMGRFNGGEWQAGFDAYRQKWSCDATPEG